MTPSSTTSTPSASDNRPDRLTDVQAKPTVSEGDHREFSASVMKNSRGNADQRVANQATITSYPFNPYAKHLFVDAMFLTRTSNSRKLTEGISIRGSHPIEESSPGNKKNRSTIGRSRNTCFNPGAGPGLIACKLSIDEDADIIAIIMTKLRSNFIFQSLEDDVLFSLACQFELLNCDPEVTVIEQSQGTVSGDKTKLYYYILCEGECRVEKNGFKIQGLHGILTPGATFGERALLFEDGSRAASIIASKGNEYGKITFCRLEAAIFRHHVNGVNLKGIQMRLQGIMSVLDVLSGIDTKVEKGTVMHTYRPERRWLIRQWKGTILQFVWKIVILMMCSTAGKFN